MFILLKFYRYGFYRAAQTQSSDKNSVCLSVRSSVSLSVRRVHCDKTEGRSVQIFIPYERTFREKNGWWGRPLLPKILGQPAPIGAKSPIFNRYLLVAPQP